MNELIYYKFLVYLKIYNYFKNMAEENTIQESILKNIDGKRNYFLEEIKENVLMCKKHRMISIYKLY